MRKFYLLTTLILGLFVQNTKAQDVANFNFTVGANNTVNFSNTSVIQTTGLHKAYWFFGDGIKQMTSPLSGTQHQYANGGVYTVCLKIYKYSTSTNDSIVTADICKTVTLQNTTADSCKAEFTDTTHTSSPLIKIFVAQPWHNHNKKPEQICWYFGDGTDTCINYNPSLNNTYPVEHHYAQAGVYNVCVKIKYQGGCITTYCRNVIIGSGDPCKSDFNTEPVIASPLSRKFVALPWHYLQKKPLKICWQFGDGTPDTCIFYTTASTGPYTINHTYANYGQYNVCVKILYDGGCEALKCKPTVIAQPTPSGDSCNVNIFEVATNLNHIERHFYATTSPNKIAQKICWYFGDGTDTCIILTNPPSPLSLNITHHYPGPGTYTLCAKVWYVGGCIVTRCRQVVIQSTTNLCGGYMTDSLMGPKTFKFKGFSIMNTNDHVISWKWTFGDGSPMGFGQQVTHTYVNGGTYQVCLVITTDLGCETHICKPMHVQGNVQPQLVLMPNPVVSTLNAIFQSILQQQVIVTIYNSNGIVVGNYTKNAVIGTNNWTFNVGSLPSGAYSMVVHSPNQIANAIFFKQ